jgi:hypothetical protein
MPPPPGGAAVSGSGYDGVAEGPGAAHGHLGPQLSFFAPDFSPDEAWEARQYPPPPPVPSSAVYVKNIDPQANSDDIEAAFSRFLNDGAQMLIVPYFDRGVAFVDLGSTEGAS